MESLINVRTFRGVSDKRNDVPWNVSDKRKDVPWNVSDKRKDIPWSL